MEELGLFPLPVVLVPTERLPLHIFEPRYRELVGECVETGSEFGIVLAAGDGAVHEIGTRAAVTDVLEVLEDGRMNVVVEGRERFRLLELTSGRSFTTGIVEEVQDEDEPPDAADVERARELFGRLSEAAGAGVEVPDAASRSLAWELAARVELEPAAKQELLALTSPRVRMRRLTELLDVALETLRTAAAIRERASRNGKVTPPADL
jgi:Lon protease-like protein